MKQKKITKLDNIIDNNTRLKAIVARANKIKNLNDFVIDLLDQKLKAHTSVANYRNGTLTLSTTSAAYAYQLRFHTDKLLKDIKASCSWQNLCRIDIKVMPKESELKKVEKNITRTISEENSNILSCLAEHVSDLKLKNTLLKLAKHTKH